jgi:hypothetical protein
MGRGTPIRWERRSATLAGGRTIAWTWQPAGRYPQVITAHVDGAHVADRIESDAIAAVAKNGTLTISRDRPEWLRTGPAQW